MKIPLLTLMLCLCPLLARLQAAEDCRWVPTHSWKGRGSLQTEKFTVAGHRWRVRARALTSGKITVKMREAAINIDRTLLTSSRRPMSVRPTFNHAPGEKYFIVDTENTPWEIVLEQYLSTSEEVRLLLDKKHDQSRKLAEWTGEESRELALSIPADPCQVTASLESGYPISVEIFNHNGDSIYKKMCRTPEDIASCWLTEAGEYKIYIAARQSPWRVVVSR